MIAIASDHGAVELKRVLCRHMDEEGIEYEDLGTEGGASVDYPDFAHRLAEGVVSGRFASGVLLCGTGLGMSMAANRHARVRAALCSESYSAAMARRHNDANVLCMGGRVIGPELAIHVLDTFLSTPFEGGRHGRRVAKIECGAEG